MDTARRIELLRSTRFFSEAPQDLLATLAGRCEEVSLEPGEVLFEQGQPGDALYVVDDGILEIYLDDTHLDESRRGECLGEMALVTDDPRSASIRAKERSDLLKLDQAVFREVIDQNPQLAWGVIRELAAKVKSSIRARVEAHRFTVRLEEAFARSVSRSVMEAIMGSRNPDQHLAGSIKQVTALFADVRSFATLWERLEPNELFHHLNEYLGAMVEVILDNGGTLDRFVGDGILAHFGAPLSGKKDAWKAVQCASQMHARLAELNKTGKYLPQHPMQIGVGLATGMVVAGCVGNERRMEYTAIGDVVNLAAGVESLTPLYRTGILLCDETARHIGSDLLLREVDRVRIKGRGRPTHIYDVLAAPEEATPRVIGLLRDYRYAFALYAAGRFDEAAAQFEALSRAFPNDGPTATLAERCRALQVSPPLGWECVYEPGLHG